MKATILSGAILLSALAAGCAGQSADRTTAAAATKAGVPRFEVDPAWPKVPEKYRLGDASSIGIDAQDNIWVLHRPRTLKPEQAKQAAPAILVFGPAGNFIKAWGGAGSGFEWPEREHGIHIDYKGHVWMGGNNCPARGLPGLSPVADDQILKFTQDGKFVMQIGRASQSKGNADTVNLRQPADVWVHRKTNELFVADGYGNHRVIVFDADTGAYKRHWGANGRPPGDASVKGFGNPVHCIRLSRDGLVYVCDRANNRIQVFRKDGTFVREFVAAPETRGNGSTWDLDLSQDAQQTHLYTADGENNQVWLLLRESGRTLGSFGRSGRSAGQFHWIHNMAVDSAGNIYTTEVDSGKRAQKFTLKSRP
jgi:DNA-binding beta-propeller fold protein YncE